MADRYPGQDSTSCSFCNLSQFSLVISLPKGSRGQFCNIMISSDFDNLRVRIANRPWQQVKQKGGGSPNNKGLHSKRKGVGLKVTAYSFQMLLFRDKLWSATIENSCRRPSTGFGIGSDPMSYIGENLTKKDHLFSVSSLSAPSAGTLSTGGSMLMHFIALTLENYSLVSPVLHLAHGTSRDGELIGNPGLQKGNMPRTTSSF